MSDKLQFVVGFLSVPPAVAGLRSQISDLIINPNRISDLRFEIYPPAIAGVLKGAS
jgi:hypothetical protein